MEYKYHQGRNEGVFCVLPVVLLTWRSTTTGVYSYLIQGRICFASVNIFGYYQCSSPHNRKITIYASKCLKPSLRWVNRYFSLPCDWEWSSLLFAFPASHHPVFGRIWHMPAGLNGHKVIQTSSTGTIALQSHNTLGKSCSIMESERLPTKQQILSENCFDFMICINYLYTLYMYTYTYFVYVHNICIKMRVFMSLKPLHFMGVWRKP